MSGWKHSSVVRLGLAAWLVAALAGCGGGGGGGNSSGVANGGNAAVAATAANSSATNPLAAFTAISGIPLVTVASPPHVNFTVINKNGQVVQGLTLGGTPVTDPQTNSTVTCNTVRFAIAKLVRDPLGEVPDQWVNYIYRTEAGTPGVGPGGVVQAPNSKQATTDPTTNAALSFNSAGYYTYTFSTDIRTPTAANNNVAFEPSRTHRVAIELCYVDSDGSIVQVNPYYDFTLVQNPNLVTGYISQPVINPANTRVMVDKASCNVCHDKLAAHGGGRVDPQYCVLCHNPSTTDANSGNVLDFKMMIHNIHAGQRLATATDGAPSTYEIWGYLDKLSDFSKVGFPQDLRNCTKCHNGFASNDPNVAVVTPQGDNWETQASKGACLTCHKTDAWYLQPAHITLLALLNPPNQSVNAIADNICKGCHSSTGGLNVDPARVHLNQIQTDAANYQFNFDAPPTYNSNTRTVTLKYSITNPANNNAAYDLKADCAGNCNSSNIFGNVQILIGSLTLVGAPAPIADYTSSSSTSVYAYSGTDDGTHHYTVTTPALPNSGAAQSHGTARALSYGQVLEAQLNPISRVPVAPAANVNVPMRNQFVDFSLDGTGAARRIVVSNAACEACHGMLGTASGSNTLANAFHSGAGNSVAGCPICHDANYLANDVNVGGVAYNESFQFKRMVHGIHSAGASTEANWTGRAKDFIFGDMTAAAPNTGIDFSVVVKYPGILSDCSTCHVGTSFQNDGGLLGTNVHTNTTIKTPDNLNDPLFNNVISPEASSCSGCHDDVVAMSHMVTVGGAVFGTTSNINSPIQCGAVPTSVCGSVSGMLAVGGSANVVWTGGWTQMDILGSKVLEECDGCHAPGAIEDVDIVHANGTGNRD
ncbi:MAG: OmcA/MtrC family decaheme c-type cytochrome [Thiobacillaceae bacterium]